MNEFFNNNKNTDKDIVEKRNYCSLCHMYPFVVTLFVAFVVRQCHYEFNTVFLKSCIVFCARPKEVDPIKLISLRQTSVSVALKIYDQQQRIKINRIRTSMTVTLSFFIKNIFIRYIVLLPQ